MTRTTFQNCLVQNLKQPPSLLLTQIRVHPPLPVFLLMVWLQKPLTLALSYVRQSIYQLSKKARKAFWMNLIQSCNKNLQLWCKLSCCPHCLKPTQFAITLINSTYLLSPVWNQAAPMIYSQQKDWWSSDRVQRIPGLNSLNVQVAWKQLFAPRCKNLLTCYTNRSWLVTCKLLFSIGPPKGKEVLDQ